MVNEKKTTEEIEIKESVHKLSDEDLDNIYGGKKVWIEPIKPQAE